MPHRQFIDSHGRRWSVWDIIPSAVTFDLASTTASRTESRAAARLPEQFSDGWLCFEREGEKRRLAPLPSQWATLPSSRLEELCRQAATVLPRTRTISASAPSALG